MKRKYIFVFLTITVSLFSRDTKKFIKVYDIPDMSYNVYTQAGVTGVMDFSIEPNGNFFLYNTYGDKIYFVDKSYTIVKKIEEFSHKLPKGVDTAGLSNRVLYSNNTLFVISEFKDVLISDISDISQKSYSFSYQDYLSNWSDYTFKNVVYYDHLVIGELDNYKSKSYYSFEIPQDYKGEAIYRHTQDTIDYIKNNFTNKNSLWVDKNNYIHIGDKPLVSNTKTFYDYFNTKSPDVFKKLTKRAFGLKFMGNDINDNYYYESDSSVIYIFNSIGQYLVHFDNNLNEKGLYRSSYNMDSYGNIFSIVMNSEPKSLTIYKLDRDW